jgi:hypothetical protein
MKLSIFILLYINRKINRNLYFEEVLFIIKKVFVIYRKKRLLQKRDL